MIIRPINTINTGNQYNSTKRKSTVAPPSFGMAWKFKTSKAMLLVRPCDPEKNTINVVNAIKKATPKLDEITKDHTLTVHHKDKGSYEDEELRLVVRKIVPQKEELSETLLDVIRPYASSAIKESHLGDPNLDKNIISIVKKIIKEVDKDDRKTFLDGLQWGNLFK